MDIINQAREYYRKSSSNYQRGNIWQKNTGNCINLINIINQVNTPKEVYETLVRYDMYNITIRSEVKFNLMMEWNKREAGLVDHPNYVTTPNLYKMYFYSKRIERVWEKRANKTILELGGGNGQFSFIAKHYLKYKTHIDVDIPESLYMAYVCTRMWFPEAKCLWVTDERNIDIKDYDFIFIPVGKENILFNKDIDLFVNTASMGEMSNDNIRYWMDFVQNKINVKFFFGFNRFLNTIYYDKNDNWHKIRSNENEASVLFDKRWITIDWEVEPSFSRCPIEDPRIARYLLIMAFRTEKEEKIEEIGKDIEDINFYHLDVLKENDWWCYKDIPATATYRDNQLVNDMTYTGTLHTLWEYIRLGDKEMKKQAVEMMLVYLKHLRRNDVIFEEEIYYRKLLETLL